MSTGLVDGVQLILRVVSPEPGGVSLEPDRGLLETVGVSLEPGGVSLEPDKGLLETVRGSLGVWLEPVGGFLASLEVWSSEVVSAVMRLGLPWESVVGQLQSGPGHDRSALRPLEVARVPWELSRGAGLAGKGVLRGEASGGTLGRVSEGLLGGDPSDSTAGMNAASDSLAVPLRNLPRYDCTHMYGGVTGGSYVASVFGTTWSPEPTGPCLHFI